MSIQSEINRIGDGVDDIKAAITEKGGTIPESAKVNDLGDIVRNLPSGTGGMTEEAADAKYMPKAGRTTASGADYIMFGSTSTDGKTSTGLGMVSGTLSIGVEIEGGENGNIAFSSSGGKVVTNINDVMKRALLDALDIYPVGIIVPFYDNNDHSAWLGYSWQRVAEGRTLVGIAQGDADFGTIGKQLGEKAHVLTEGEVPPLRSHSLLSSSGGSNDRVEGYNGNGGPHNNIQPSEVVAYWRRTA